MQVESDWKNTASPGAGAVVKPRANKRPGLARKLTAGFLLGASLMSAGFALASAPIPTGTTAPVTITAGKLYGQLEEKVASSAPESRLRVIVHLKEQVDLSTWPASDRAGAITKLQDVASRTQSRVISAMESAASINVYERFWIFNGFAVEAPASILRDIAARSDVDYILEDGIMTAPQDIVEEPDNAATNWNIYQVRAPETWALGYDGTGVVVANQDSGVDGAHEALETRWRGVAGGTPANSWKDPFGGSPTFPIDEDGHGTHTMGTITGRQGDATGINEIGQAKGAHWIACRIYDASGRGPFSYIHSCFQWMLDPDGNPNTNDQPAVVSNSWGDSLAYQYPDLEWWNDIVAWRAVGIIPVFSNGNNGSAGYTVGNPGAYPLTTGVGALAQNRTIAGFSSRGPAPDLPPYNNPIYWDRTNWGLIKPDITAPGVSIRSSFPGDTYGSISGTSMAAPHVAGLAGILRQVRSDLTVNEFANIIKETAYVQASFGTIPNNTFGWGEIDDYAAAVYVRDAGAILGDVTDGSCATDVAGATMWVYTPCADVNANGECGIRKMITDNNGHYRTILAAGTYTVTIEAPGYYGQMFNTTVMSSTTNTLPITLVKQPSGTLQGTVTDAGSTPVAGASVYIVGLGRQPVITNGSGQYTIFNVPAGNFTVRAEKADFNVVQANVAISNGNTTTQNLQLTGAISPVTDDFEDGDLAGWTVTGGSPTTGIWHNSTLRSFGSGTHAARAGQPAAPFTYTGSINTVLSTTNSINTSGSFRVWLSFDLYDDAESEYDIFKVQLSTDGGATWPETGALNGTVFGQASPIHGWQHIELDITHWSSAQLKFRFKFATVDSSNWNGEWFEGPTVDNVRLSVSSDPGVALPAQTPTPGTPVPCGQATPTPTSPPATSTATSTPGSGSPTATPTACTLEFADVLPGNTFYANIHCLACRGIINGYPCGGDGEPCNPSNDPYFRPSNNITRGQLAKVVSQSAGFNEPVTEQTFEDVAPNTTFYDYVGRLVIHDVMGGYPCGIDPNEPCNPPGNLPYFRPGANATRGQLTKIVSNAAGFSDPAPASFTFTDVPEGSTFHLFVERLLINRPGVMNGYPCGGPGEPCDSENRPYFRPSNTLTRGQTSKIVANTFFPGCSVR